MNLIPKTDEYTLLVEDIRSALTEGGFIARQVLIKIFYSVGERIVHDELYQKYGKGNQAFIKQLAEDVKGDSDMPIGKSRLYEMIQVAEKYDSYEKLDSALAETGKNASWNKAVMLARGEKPKIVLKCRHCPIDGHCPEN